MGSVGHLEQAKLIVVVFLPSLVSSPSPSPPPKHSEGGGESGSTLHNTCMATASVHRACSFTSHPHLVTPPLLPVPSMVGLNPPHCSLHRFVSPRFPCPSATPTISCQTHVINTFSLPNQYFLVLGCCFLFLIASWNSC